MKRIELFALVLFSVTSFAQSTASSILEEATQVAATQNKRCFCCFMHRGVDGVIAWIALWRMQLVRNYLMTIL